MIFNLFSNPLMFFMFLLALLSAITIHECSHAIAADYLGDPTGRIQGRISLNPLVHLDLYGMVFLLFFGFGWGKPVQFDPFNLKNPRRDAALISIAGPVSNFILAIILSIIAHLWTAGILILTPFITINVMLGVFNLVPVHPLDGFKIVGGILSREQAASWYQLERYGYLFLLLLILPIGNGNMLSSVIGPVVNTLIRLLLPSTAGVGFV
jgi:Zn-dependent protease